MAKKEESVLSFHQKQILDIVADTPYFRERFYLAGGTALSEFYLKHRISEDLDFLTEIQEVNQFYIIRFFESQRKFLKLEKIETKRILGLSTIFFHFSGKEVLKVDFNYYPFPRIEKGLKYKNFEIESIYDIAVDKIHTIALNPRARDYIDIYFIIKEKGYDLKKLILDAKAKFDWEISPIDLGARLIECLNLSDYPRMLKKIAHREWKEFFLNEALKLKSEIFKK
ncbi:MAG: nucleotidyl transferase AbiEii/AbiGii toxin family protein [bacterium]